MAPAGDLEGLLGRLPVSRRARDDLRARLAEPHRHYHGRDHVALLWGRHLQFGAGLPVRTEPWDTLVACAIAFHDAVYDPPRRDNEVASARLWRSAKPDLPAWATGWVTGTILATADHLAAEPDEGMSGEAWAARAWMLDLDLTPIGEMPDEFRANTARLRLEHAGLADGEWEAGRLGFLGRLASAPRLFRSAPLAAAFEAAARANIAREIALARS